MPSQGLGMITGWRLYLRSLRWGGGIKGKSFCYGDVYLKVARDKGLG